MIFKFFFRYKIYQIIMKKNKMDLSSTFLNLSLNDQISLNYRSIDNTNNSFLNLKHKPITVENGEFYNLETSRKLTKPGDRSYLMYPPVAGNVCCILEFLFINRIPLNQVKFAKNCKIRNELINLMNNRKPHFITYTSIDQIPFQELNKLYPFSFTNMMIQSKVCKIIDGDTFDCAILLDPRQLACPTAMKDGHRTVIGQNCSLCYPYNPSQYNQENGMKILLKLRIRLYGADASDSSPTKEIATDFVNNWFKMSNYCIWLQLMGNDCRSRTLGDIYHRFCDISDSKSLTSCLLEYKHPIHGTVAIPYYGGNKTDAWKPKKKIKNKKQI